MNLFSLEGKIALVTGAGSGIGQRIAIGLAEAGASVACFDLPASAGLKGTLEQIQCLKGTAISVTGDVTQAGDLTKAVDVIEHDLGPLSLAVNCAGIANAAAAEEMPLAQWQRMLDVNLTGIFLSCQAEGKVMLARREGSIVNIASMSGIIVNRGLLQAHYNTSKAGVIHLSKSLAMEWSNRGVRVNSISPGSIRTPMLVRSAAHFDPDLPAETVFERFGAAHPLGRIGTPEEVAELAAFLASDKAGFCTGGDYLVDGGLLAGLGVQ